MSDFLEEQKRIEEKIWSFAQIKCGVKVLDVGIGENAHSTKKLIGLGALVTAIDTDSKTLNKHRNLKIDLVQGGASQLPFISSEFDLSVAYFTLHEIDPNLHRRVVSELIRVSRSVMIVEPELGEDRLYGVYHDIWSRAMHSIGRFEDYRPITFWKMLLEECGADVAVCQKIAHEEKLMGIEADKFMKGVIGMVRNYGVPEGYVSEFRDLAEDMKHLGMRFSDISVVIGDVL